MFKRLWNPRHGLSCKPLGNNTILFMFKNKIDMRKVLNGSPWLFDKSLLALTEADASQIGSNIEVSSCQFWIQIHDMPIGLMNKAFAEKSRNTIGKFLEVDVDTDGCSFGRFLQVARAALRYYGVKILRLLFGVFLDRFIDVDVELMGQSFRFTGVYGEPNVSLRRNGWNHIRSLLAPLDKPWLMCGDFNEVLSQCEFQGTQPRADWQINLFRDTLTHLNVFDLGFEGSHFTWDRLSLHPRTQRARLDRAISNPGWKDLFPWSRVRHIPSFSSDHSLIHIQIRNRDPSAYRGHKRRPFRFEALWVRVKDCEEIIKNCWDNTTGPLPDKLRDCSIGLLNWGNQYKDDLEAQVDKLKNKIASLRSGNITEATKTELADLQQKLDLCLDLLDLKWKQRAKLHWYKEGDRNTRFFHNRASNRKQINHISYLKDDTGHAHHTPEGIEKIIIDYFGGLFSSSEPSPTDIAQALDRLTPRVTPAMNHMLSEPFTEKEIIKALSTCTLSNRLAPMAIPTYAMSCFKFPDSVISDIQGLISSFWWGSTPSHRKLHWSSWDSLARRKELGGLGFRSFKAFNLALLSKQAWRLLSNPYSLLAQVYKAKYYYSGTVFEARLGFRPSWAWRSIFQEIRVLKLGCLKRINSGANSKIWGDPWIPKPPFSVQSPTPDFYPPDIPVSTLIQPGAHTWNSDLIFNLFSAEEATLILSIPSPFLLSPDYWYWFHNKHGKFSVKSTYHLILNYPGVFPEAPDLISSSLGQSPVWKNYGR
ncbi:hypothetical protein DH2020_012596 [Rehmannia glutinosa]|uniref:DUF4283 domain-containing protein n=1 Tax=Rehmannia glutinosa TaxID=99300 RepID=A0ABR0WZS9_REHGL